MKRLFLLVSVFLGGCAAENGTNPATDPGSISDVEAHDGRTPNANATGDVALPGTFDEQTQFRVTIAGGEKSSDVYSAAFTNDGKLGEWKKQESLPNAEHVSLVPALEGFLAIGDSGAVMRSVSKLDGTISHWRTMDQVKSMQGGSVSSSSSSLFLIGTDASLSTTLDNGLPKAFGEDYALPTARSFASAARLGAFTFVTGGSTASGATNEVVSAEAKPTGGHERWTTSTALPTALSEHAMFTNLDDLFVVGGKSTNVEPNVYRAHMNDDGSLGKWTEMTKLPVARAGACVATSGSRIFVMGGYSETEKLDDVLTTTIEADGSLAPWTVIGKLPNGVVRPGCGIN